MKVFMVMRRDGVEEKQRKKRREREKIEYLGTQRARGSTEKMAEFYRDQAVGRDVEAQPLGGRALGFGVRIEWLGIAIGTE